MCSTEYSKTKPTKCLDKRKLCIQFITHVHRLRSVSVPHAPVSTEEAERLPLTSSSWWLQPCWLQLVLLHPAPCVLAPARRQHDHCGKKMPGLICSSWRQGTHSSSFKCIPEIQVRAPNFRCFCSLYCQGSTCKMQFREFFL